MREIVIGVFDTASAAKAAVQDLEVARIPSAVVQQEIREGSEPRDDSSPSGWRRSASAGQRPLVTVVVDEMHAAAVTGILELYGPRDIEERTVQSRRR